MSPTRLQLQIMNLEEEIDDLTEERNQLNSKIEQAEKELGALEDMQQIIENRPEVGRD